MIALQAKENRPLRGSLAAVDAIGVETVDAGSTQSPQQPVTTKEERRIVKSSDAGPGQAPVQQCSLMEAPTWQAIKIGKDLGCPVRALAVQYLVVTNDFEIEISVEVRRDVRVSMLARGNDQNQDNPPYVVVYTK